MLRRRSCRQPSVRRCSADGERVNPKGRCSSQRFRHCHTNGERVCSSQGLGHCLVHGEGEIIQGLGRCLADGEKEVIPRARPLPCRQGKVRSSQRLGHCLADGEKEVIPRTRPLPCRWGKGGHPEGSAIALPTGKGASSQRLSHCLVDGEREIPEWRSSQRFGRSLANGECEEVQSSAYPPRSVHPKGSAIASPMGKAQKIQTNLNRKSSANALPRRNQAGLSRLKDEM